MAKPPDTDDDGGQWFERNDGPTIVTPATCYALWPNPLRTVSITDTYVQLWENGKAKVTRRL